MMAVRSLVLQLAVALACVVASSATVGITNVVLISVDGMHPSDLTQWIALAPNSTLANLAKQGTIYSNAYLRNTAADSFPGLMALITGATPATTGIYYDDSYSRVLSPPLDPSALANSTAGDLRCTILGTEVLFDDSIDIDGSVLDGGGGANTTFLPRNKSAGCTPVYPWMYNRATTVFEVVKAAGGSTAWSDKHTAAYTIVQGPSGKGVDQMYTPEVAAESSVGISAEQYDTLKTNVINGWITGNSSAVNATTLNGTLNVVGNAILQQPTLCGGDFQILQDAQGNVGYAQPPGNFSPAILAAMNLTDQNIGSFVQSLKVAGTLNTTAFIVTAKHGQTPLNNTLFNQISPDNLTSVIQSVAPNEPAELTTDTSALIYLFDNTTAPAIAAALMNNSAALGINKVYYGASLIAAGFGDPATSPTTPDIIVDAFAGVSYTGGPGDNTTFMNHGGFSDDDIHVGLLVSVNGGNSSVYTGVVNTTQVAVTILDLLGIPSTGLKGAVADNTTALPGLPIPSNTSSVGFNFNASTAAATTTTNTTSKGNGASARVPLQVLPTVAAILCLIAVLA